MFLDSDNFGVRLKYFMNKKKKTALFIAQEIGVTKSAVTNWSNGIRFPKDEERLIKISEILDVNFIDLFTNSSKNRHKIVIDELKNNLNNYIEHIPTLSIPPSLKKVRVTKGYPSSSNDIIEENSMHYATNIFIDKRMVKTAYQDKELEAAVMIGNSMSPYLENDDLAIYHPTPPIGDGRYVINTPHGLTIKNLKFKTNGSILLISENPKYNTPKGFDEEFLKEDIDALEILGLVVGRILKS